MLGGGGGACKKIGIHFMVASGEMRMGRNYPLTKLLNCGTLKYENTSTCEKVAICEKNIDAKCKYLRYNSICETITLNVKTIDSLIV